MAPSASDLPQVVIIESASMPAVASTFEGGTKTLVGRIEKASAGLLLPCTYSQFYDHGKRLFSALIDALKTTTNGRRFIHVGDAASDQEFAVCRRYPPD